MRLFKKKETPEPPKRMVCAYWEIIVHFIGKTGHLVVTYEGDSAEENSLKQFNNLDFDFESSLLAPDGSLVRIAEHTIEVAYRTKKTRLEEA